MRIQNLKILSYAQIDPNRKNFKESYHVEGERRIALVTGANKGIGLEIARQLATSGVHVLLGARDVSRGAIAADQLSKEGLDVSCVQIDVCDEESILKAALKIESEYGKLDTLVNNAGIVVQGDTAPSAAPLNVVRKVFDTNFFGVVAVVQAIHRRVASSTYPAALDH
jgi:NAD(P)-dependent dehydrogenase (short-subunit alcohol dehydrogenase family)